MVVTGLIMVYKTRRNLEPADRLIYSVPLYKGYVLGLLCLHRSLRIKPANKTSSNQATFVSLDFYQI